MGRHTRLFTAAIALLVAGFMPSLLRAQSAKGSISGTVLDQARASVPNAAVSATNLANGEVYKTTTDSSGLFKLSLLAVGSYNVEISKPGFRKLRLEGVAVTTGTDHGLGTLALNIGEVTSTVEVRAAPPLLQTSQAQITNVIPLNLLQSYPGIEENEGLDNLAVGLPGVVNSRDVSFSNSNGLDFSVNGIRSRNNDQQIDGQNNNDNSVAGPYLFLSNPDFVQEYQITTDQFGAQYGRNSGSVVNIITRSGGSVWHGAITGTESNSALNSLSTTQKFFEGLNKPPRFNDEFTSATIGGPVWRNHVFMFGGFDDEIVSSKTVYATGLLTPTPAGLAEMAGCFPGSKSVAALTAFGPYGIGGGSPTPSGTVQTQKLTGGSFSGFTPNNVDGKCHVDVDGVQRGLSDSTHEYDWVYRVDVVVNPKDRFYGRYIYQKIIPFNADSFGTAAAGYPNNVPSFGGDIGLSWAHTFTSRMANEARFSYGRLNVEFGGNSIGNTIPNQTNIGDALARISFSSTSLLGFGPATNAPQGRIVNTYQVQDNWSYVVGRHQLTAGVNFTHQRSPNVFLPNFNGSFRFSNLSTFAQDVPNRIQIALGNPKLPFKENDLFLYFGDDWKVTQNLTLNLGLTWSYYGQPANLFNQEDLAHETSSKPFWNPNLSLAIRTFPKIPAPKNAFGPGIGFAYSPQWGGWLTGKGKTVLRGGYRLTYDPPYYNIYVNISSSAPQVLLQTLSKSASAGVPLLAAPFGPANRSELASFLTLGVFDPRGFNQTSITPNFGPDRVHEWSFGIQRQLGSNAVFEARYVGNHGFDLFQSINANPFVADLASTFPNALPAGVTPCPKASAVVPSAVGRVNCNEGVLRERTNSAFSDYNALQLELRTNNLFNQLTMRAGYTFSKTTDNVTEIFGTFGAGNSLAFSQNPLDFTKSEHGLSGLDIPHAFTLSFIEDLPFFRSEHGVLGHILGGWGTASTYILTSGQPYTPQQFALGTFTGAVGEDTNFDLSFAGTFETLRPFIGNTSAPASSVGILAGDACSFFGVTGLEPVCVVNPATLISFNAVNTTSDISTFVPTPITKNQVHFIINGGEAQSLVGRPFGNAGRNSLRTSKVNSVNITVFKNIKFGERTTLRWHMSMLDAFNHPNYTGGAPCFSSIDPFIDDAGLATECTGFANPLVTSGGNRSIRFGLKVIF